MKNNSLAYFLLGIAIVVVGAFFYFSTESAQAPIKKDLGNVTQKTSTTSSSTLAETGTSSASAQGKMTIKIALLDTAGKTNGKKLGCDRVVMISKEVPRTSAVLSSAMKELFSINQNRVSSNDWYNFIANTKDTLKFDRASIVNGTANIYLTGSLSGLAGVCDDPRAKNQIDETALQFPSVQNIQIYLNGSSTTLIPSKKGT
jgi:hypothetical protein